MAEKSLVSFYSFFYNLILTIFCAVQIPFILNEALNQGNDNTNVNGKGWKLQQQTTMRGKTTGPSEFVYQPPK
jgi:hypothetical protein